MSLYRTGLLSDPLFRRDEQCRFYHTKDTILSIYDAMAESIRTGQPYQTRLDPPPGPPATASGTLFPMAQWDRIQWPSHIHQPKESEA